MDENEYRAVYHTVNEVRCCFEKAMLTRRFGCQKLVKMNIADREAAGCGNEACKQTCLQVLQQLRANAAFALKTTSTNSPLPHAKEIKAQCGGMIGLYQCLHPEETAIQGVDDIFGTISQAITQFDGIEKLPYAEIVKTITHFEGRKKRRSKR